MKIRSRYNKQWMVVLGILLWSGLAVAHCGQCEGDKKDDHEHKDGKKTCCTKEGPCCHTEKAPDFTLKDVDGKEIQLSKLKGKIVVLEWANYDCPFVKAHYEDEVQTMNKLAAKYADKDVVWLTINSTHYATPETNKKWILEHNVKQTVLIDNDGKVGKLFKAKTTPHMFIVDKSGKLVYQGAIDNAPMGKKPEDKGLINYVDKALAELTSESAITIAKTKPYGCSVKYAKP